SSDLAPQSGASIVNAPKQEAEGVTIRPLESRSEAVRSPDSSAPAAKSPALSAISPQHHCSLGNPTWNPAAVAMRSSATADSGHTRSARQDAKMVSGSPSTRLACTLSRYGVWARRG